jgi:MoxR-like ATPase
MPSDIAGTDILEEDAATGRRAFRFERGPVFANLVLADEINRSPPKAQAALLEAMQEREITHGGTTYPLPLPFFVLATQNPIEQAGTYPLPEAQLDRFLLYLKVEYPDAAEEVEVLAATTGAGAAAVQPVLGAEELIAAQALVRQVHLSRPLTEYAAALVRATRPSRGSGSGSGNGNGSVPEAVRELVAAYVDWGAGPRAGQAMILTAKAAAFLDGRLSVTLADLERVAPPVLRHRVLLNYRAQAEGLDADEVTRRLLAAMPRPASPLR